MIQVETQINVNNDNFLIIRRFFMAAEFLPSILVPLVGLVFPAVVMTALFIYVEKQQVVRFVPS